MQDNYEAHNRVLGACAALIKTQYGLNNPIPNAQNIQFTTVAKAPTNREYTGYLHCLIGVTAMESGV